MKIIQDTAGQMVQKRTRSLAKYAIFVVVVTLVMPVLASAARQRYVLDLGDSHLVGRRNDPVILPLKRLLRQQYPGIDFCNLELKRVVLVAKTKKGKGYARLRVGRRYTDAFRVYGRPEAFRLYNKHSFDKIGFTNPAGRESSGPWQLFLQGNFRVRKVVVVVERDHNLWEGYGSSRLFSLQFRNGKLFLQ